MARDKRLTQSNTNAGFTLVELIIVVAILAIAAVPLIRSISMSANVNAKAQSMQNATSLGERVMEEMKSLSIDQIKAKYGGGFDAEGKVYNVPEFTDTATQGLEYKVKVKIDTTSYSGAVLAEGETPTPVTTKKQKVESANTYALPEIEDIDQISQAVISTKEINKYDKAARSFFDEKKADFNPASPVHATINKKTIIIFKDDITTDHGVSVSAKVVYESGTGLSKLEYVRNLYSGSFVETEDKDGVKQKLDSNIYIIYGANHDASDLDPVVITDTFISITDDSDYLASDEKPDDSHRVYFIMQKPETEAVPMPAFPTFDFHRNGTSEDSVGSGSLVDGNGEFAGIKFYSNYSSDATKPGKIYKEDTKNRVYGITVELYDQNGDLVTTLDSTKTAKDKFTPTPSPEPTEGP